MSIFFILFSYKLVAMCGHNFNYLAENAFHQYFITSMHHFLQGASILYNCYLTVHTLT